LLSDDSLVMIEPEVKLRKDMDDYNIGYEKVID
jgi:hypothetical protein